MRGVLVVALLASLSACNDSKAETAVKDLLIDPESAQFSDVVTNGSTTCGFVNSKNRMGGYVGRTAFLYEDGVARLSSVDDADFITKFGSKCPSDLVLRFLQMRLSK